MNELPLTVAPLDALSYALIWRASGTFAVGDSFKTVTTFSQAIAFASQNRWMISGSW